MAYKVSKISILHPFKPLAQTWHVKKWCWKPNFVKCESNF
ncbi:hypothetical protein D1BOALGB6SA_4056 [Olavius sp. associated proteobacterium Delta 1]|nr:hypothetical protein D1BOALGB6SA_4056 [Olavius sp. associated proteobacterium Delta 1]